MHRVENWVARTESATELLKFLRVNHEWWLIPLVCLLWPLAVVLSALKGSNSASPPVRTPDASHPSRKPELGLETPPRQLQSPRDRPA